ncbi:MAG: TlpA family protein disulfide reductase [Deltaproteobacteria bacterium]|nr:TlpA family protein disulfide reductase [Deltaproteobacteria bacterium]
MRRRSFRVALSIWGMILCATAAGWAAGTPPVGGQLPDFTLAVPKDAAQRSYLGLSGSGAFRIPQIHAKTVIIEIFSMYCPFCQKEAPNVNRVYRMIEADPALRGKIKLVGIGVGNSAYEVEAFQKKYDIPFPLFPDGDFTLHRLLGEARTPYFIGVKIGPDGSHRVIHSCLGAFESVEKFLEEIVRESDLK